VRNALAQTADPNLILPPALQSLARSGLADQVEQLRITPEFLSSEDLSKFWTATLAHYRPCAAYRVSAALIQKELPRPLPLPVLVRNIDAVPTVLPRVPVISAVVPAAKLPVAQLGRPVALEGLHLAGTNREVLLSNDRFEIDGVLPGTGGGSERVEFTIPTASAADFPVGVYRVSVRLQAHGDDRVRETNQLALTVAPSIDGLPMTVTRSGGTASFTIAFTPALRAGQTARLVLGASEFEPQSSSGPSTTTLSFVIPNAPVDDFPARLRIDGIDSPVIDVEAKPPAFNKRIRIQ
jgi:hypothetical protein